MKNLFQILCLFFCFSTVNAQEFLNPETAFRPEISALNERSFLIQYKITKNHYLYKNRFQFEVENHKIINIKYPQGKIKNDEIFGKVEVFYNNLPIEIEIERRSQDDLNLKINATSQGCSEGGICYLPVTHPLNVVLKGNKNSNLKSNLKSNSNPSIQNEIQDESQSIFKQLKNLSFLSNLFFFFLAGLGLSLTPCVLPMIPILSGLIVRQHSQNKNQKKSFSLSCIYVLGMAFTYALAGIFAGLSGNLLSNSLQHPFVLGIFALIFVLLSISMFDFYELKMPNRIQNYLNQKINYKQGGLFSMWVMGVLSALIVGPCVAAPLAGALIYISQTGDAFLGGLALFFLALGMGAPLILVAVLGASFLPRAGLWMVYIKKTFGVILLALALWIIHPVLSLKIILFLWGSLFIVISVFLKALDSLPLNANTFARVLKGIGVILFLTGVFLLIGSFSNAKDPLNPLENIFNQSAKIKKEILFQKIKTQEELNHILKTSEKPIFLDFYADWCVVCKEMERETFQNELVFNKMKSFQLLQIDVTQNSNEDKQLLKRFQLFGPPAIILFKNGEEKNRVIGFKKAQDFLKILENI